MDLSELDKIREDLKKAYSTITDRESIIKEKDEEIVKVKADKRTVKVIEKQIPKPTVSYEFHMNMNTHVKGRYDGRFRELAQTIYYKVRSDGHERHSHYAVEEIAALLERYKFNSPINSTPEMETVTTTEYINFDDVLADISQKVEQRVASEIDGYKKQLSALNDTVTHAQINQEKAKKDLIAKYEEQIKDLNEAFIKDYKKLEEDFEAFKTDKDTRTLEQKVKDLEKELEMERNRKWYQRRKKIN